MKNRTLLQRVRADLRDRRADQGSLWRYPGGGLTLFLKIVFFVTIALEGVMNLMLMLGYLFLYDSTPYTAAAIAETKRLVVYMGVAALLAAAAVTLMILKQYFPVAGCAVLSGIMLLTYVWPNYQPNRMELPKWYESAVFRHTIPTVAFMAAAVLIALIFLFDLIEENRAYEEKLEKIYKGKAKRGQTMTNEQWEEIIHEMYPE